MLRRGFCLVGSGVERSHFLSGKFLLLENDNHVMASIGEVEAGPEGHVRDKAIAGVNKVLHHNVIKNIFDANSKTAWKGAMVGGLLISALVWYPIGYISSLIKQLADIPAGYYWSLHERLFFKDKTVYDMSGNEYTFLAFKEGRFLNEQTAEFFNGLFAGLFDILHMVVVLAIAFRYRKWLKEKFERVFERLPSHFQPYAPTLVVAFGFSLGWASARVPFPFIFGIVWNIAFPALVALFTWLSLTHKDVLLEKSRALIRLKDKIPQKRRTISMLALTTLLSFSVMAYKPNEMTQLKEQVAVLASLYVGWLWQAQLPSPSEGEAEGSSGVSKTTALLSLLLAVVWMPSVAAFDPFSTELLHPHDFLYSDQFYPGIVYPWLQCSILGAFAALIGTGIKGLLTLEPQEEASAEIEPVVDSTQPVDETVEAQPPEVETEEEANTGAPDESEPKPSVAGTVEGSSIDEPESEPQKDTPQQGPEPVAGDDKSEPVREKVASEPQPMDEVEADLPPRPAVEVPQGSFLGDFFGGMLDDVKELATGISDGVKEGVRLLSDGEFVKDAVEGMTDTVVEASDYLVNKMTLDDVKEAAGTVAKAVETLVDHAIEHPVETLVQMTPLGDLQCSIDPNKSLGERLVCMGTAVVDIASMASTGGASKGAKVGVNILQNLEKADDVKDAAKVADKVGDAKEGAKLTADVKKASEPKRLPDGDGYAEQFGEVQQGPVVHSTKGAKQLDDAHDVPRTPEPLTETVVEGRKKAWEDSKARSQHRVDEYKNALESGDEDRIKKATIELKRDKTGLQIANKDLTDGQKTAYTERSNALHNNVDDDVMQYAKERFELGELDGPYHTPSGKVWRNPETGAEFRTVESTNPTSAPKVHADRDITYRVVKPDADGVRKMSDVDHREVRPVYEKSYHKHSEAERLGYDETAKDFTNNQDQMVTDAKHAEAYGRSQREGQGILDGQLSEDSELLGDTASYKSNHWLNKNSTSGSGLEDNTFEAFRQTTKQQQSRYGPLRDELQQLNPDHHLLKEGRYAKIDPILDEMKVLQTDPLNARSPVEIELMIRDAGFASPQEFNHAVNMRTTTFEQAVRHAGGGAQ